jgi:hypothetical protein
MATIFFTYPLDVPHLESERIVNRENAAPGNDSHLKAFPNPEAGDLQMDPIPHFDPEPLSTPGAPWKNMKGGR